MSWNKKQMHDDEFFNSQAFEFEFTDCKMCSTHPVLVWIVELLRGEYGCRKIRGSFRDKAEYIAQIKHKKQHGKAKETIEW